MRSGTRSSSDPRTPPAPILVSLMVPLTAEARHFGPTPAHTTRTRNVVVAPVAMEMPVGSIWWLVRSLVLGRPHRSVNRQRTVGRLPPAPGGVGAGVPPPSVHDAAPMGIPGDFHLACRLTRESEGRFRRKPSSS